MTVPTLPQLLAARQAERDTAAARRRQARQAIDGVVAAATAENRDQMTPAEFQLVDRMLGQRDEAAGQLRRLDGELAQLRAVQADEAANFARTQIRIPAGPQQAAAVGYDRQARIGAEARTYHRGNDPAGRNFVLDVCRAQVGGDPQAWQRLSRHMAEERVERPGLLEERAAGDTNTGELGGFDGAAVPDRPRRTGRVARGARSPTTAAPRTRSRPRAWRSTSRG